VVLLLGQTIPARLKCAGSLRGRARATVASVWTQYQLERRAQAVSVIERELHTLDRRTMVLLCVGVLFVASAGRV